LRIAISASRPRGRVQYRFYDAVLVGDVHHAEAGQLRWELHVRGGSKGEYRQRTVPVDSFDANPWGLYQVHGNVWEWTEDCWNESNAGNPGDGRAWTTGNCSQRVVRGSSWSSDPLFLRSANRLKRNAVDRDYDLGFRLAGTLVP
jgi:formylglycine-generating enzyme required for sulfatase activity